MRIFRPNPLSFSEFCRRAGASRNLGAIDPEFSRMVRRVRQQQFIRTARVVLFVAATVATASILSLL